MALDLIALDIFVKVAELASFTRAADRLAIPKARVSFRVNKLEEELGVKLFRRSTRVVRITAEGERLLARARQLLAEADEVGTMFREGRSVRGRVRLDMPVTIAREVIVPQLPNLIARYPDLELTISATDRRVAAFAEGFDCLLRGGHGGDPRLVGRRLGTLRMMNCASASYLRRLGVPRSIDDLAGHLVVHYSSTLGSEAPSFEYPESGGFRELPMRSVVTVNSVEALHAACVAGLGIIQVPRVGVLAHLSAGKLVEVMPDFTCAPLPISILHTHGRSVPHRVRAVMTWMAEAMTPYIEAQA